MGVFGNKSDITDLMQMWDKYPIKQVQGGSSWQNQLRNIKQAYDQYQRRVDAGIATWMDFHPYEIGDWAAILTPIELAVWHDIRELGLPLWPQLPVSRYFVDFGNPDMKIAVECDGLNFHDVERDARRDFELGALGWTVYRIPGWMCKKTIEYPEDISEMEDEDWIQFESEREQNTTRGVFNKILTRFPEYEQRKPFDFLGTLA